MWLFVINLHLVRNAHGWCVLAAICAPNILYRRKWGSSTYSSTKCFISIQIWKTHFKTWSKRTNNDFKSYLFDQISSFEMLVWMSTKYRGAWRVELLNWTKSWHVIKDLICIPRYWFRTPEMARTFYLTYWRNFQHISSDGYLSWCSLPPRSTARSREILPAILKYGAYTTKTFIIIIVNNNMSSLIVSTAFVVNGWHEGMWKPPLLSWINCNPNMDM